MKKQVNLFVDKEVLSHLDEMRQEPTVSVKRSDFMAMLIERQYRKFIKSRQPCVGVPLVAQEE